MVFYRIISWETALDLAGIVLCGVIVVFLLYNKIKYRRWLITAGAENPPPAFKADISHHLIKQQVEKILYLVSGPLTDELTALKEMSAAEGFVPGRSLTPATLDRLEQWDDIYGCLQGCSPSGSEPDPYAEVAQLSEDGLTPQQIADKVNLPPGEIALLLKLYRVR